MNERYPHHNPGEQPDNKPQHEQRPERGYAHDNEASRERQPDRQPRVWIGSLADYNNGVLHGHWVDAAVEAEELVKAAKRIVASSETPDAEEWAIFDHDDFGDFRVNEYEDLSLVARIARGIEEHGDAYAAWAQLHDGDPGMLDSFEDAYIGEYPNATAWAEEVAEDANIEQRIQEAFGDGLASFIHFDADAFARDAFLDGSIYIAHKDDGGCWIFRQDL